MLFRDFLRVAVLLFGGAGSALAVVAIAGASAQDTTAPTVVAVTWWAIAAIAGLWMGRRGLPTPQIGRLLAAARATNTLPEVEPGTIVFNRLWPLAVATVGSGALGLFVPQVPAIAAGYAIAVALTWRKQSSAVEAIEERDGVRFYFERSSPLGAPKLLRTPGLRKVDPAEDPSRAVGPL